MQAGALQALEFDRIVTLVTDLAVTPPGRDRLADLHPLTDPTAVAAAQRATSEGVRFLTEQSAFPLRAPEDLLDVLGALGVAGRTLEPLRLLALADYLDSIARTRAAIASAGETFPVLQAMAGGAASFTAEIAGIRRTIEPSGEVADHASPALAGLRTRLRRQRAQLRMTLEGLVRGRETSKYLQEQVVTDRHGRHVLMVRAEHRHAIPGIVHGGSASGASLFVEPLETVEINNEIVALEEQEAEEVRRILLALTDRIRERGDDLARTVEVATSLDTVQARARLSLLTDAVEPSLTADGTIELRGARHPLLMPAVRRRLAVMGSGDEAAEGVTPVPVDVRLVPPARVLVITGPNTGGKTVALKTAGLFAAMAQSGLHVPAHPGSRLPVFRSIFADIGDEQSIAASLSTFSGHITNLVGMDRALALPALVLLDEVGAGTDPAEGGALGMAVIDHFRRRGAHLVATTHYDALKSYAATTEGVTSAAFGFDAATFAPTYRLVYGSPGRSLAIEMAARLGMPAPVVAAARRNLSERERQLADHLARMDRELQRLEQERRDLARERGAVAETERALRGREASVRAREETFRRRVDARVDEQLRAARQEIDAVIDALKARAAELSAEAARRGGRLHTGEAGAARSAARAALDAVVAHVREEADPPTGSAVEGGAAGAGGPAAPAPGARVAAGALGLEGVVLEVQGRHAEVDVRGKRLRVPLRDLRVLAQSAAPPRVAIRVDLLPREGSPSELNVIGCTVDEAISRAERFIDESLSTDLRTLRIVHGYGTGRLRRGLTDFLRQHPLVARVTLAEAGQGGGGATIVELKD